MNKMVIAGGIVAVAIIVSMAYGAQMNPGGNEQKRADSEIWNFRFSGPEFHDISSHKFSAIALEQNVPYKFEFVPMGDSPERIEIQLRFEGRADYSERFMLERELVDTGISKYYRYYYSGDKYFEISNMQCQNQKICNYDLDVQRFGNLKGSVSISLIAIDRSI
jgi:hypothetical protein